jgi:superfamily II DNA or RNA helicase
MAAPSFNLGIAWRSSSSAGAGPSPGTTPATSTLQPRQWQQQLIHLLRRRLEQASRDVLINAGPGAGKTLGALLSFQRLQRDGVLHHFVVFCHRSSIAEQWLNASARLGLALQEWDAERDLREQAAPGLLITYQAASRNQAALTQQVAEAGWGPWLSIADEVHHLGVDPEEPEASAWGHAFSRLSCQASLRLGLTGTPFRADNLAFCAARRVHVRDGADWVEQIAPDLSVEPRQLIAAGDVRPLEFRFQDGWVDHGREPSSSDNERSPLSLEQRESWRARNLRRAIRLGDESSIALRLLLRARSRLERVRQEHPQAGGLVIARDIAHARRIAGLLEEEGDRVQLVHSQDPEASARLQAFKQGEADWLVSIDMCAEGFDAPRLRVVAYLTTIVTRTRFLQAITRAVRMDGSRAGLESVPRQPSYVFAPADPLLMQVARTWSLSEPYLIRQRAQADPAEATGAGGRASVPLQALQDGAGEVIRMRGPQLPNIVLQR